MCHKPLLSCEGLEIFDRGFMESDIDHLARLQPLAPPVRHHHAHMQPHAKECIDTADDLLMFGKGGRGRNGKIIQQSSGSVHFRPTRYGIYHERLKLPIGTLFRCIPEISDTR